MKQTWAQHWSVCSQWPVDKGRSLALVSTWPVCLPFIVAMPITLISFGHALYARRLLSSANWCNANTRSQNEPTIHLSDWWPDRRRWFAQLASLVNATHSDLTRFLPSFWFNTNLLAYNSTAWNVNSQNYISFFCLGKNAFWELKFTKNLNGLYREFSTCDK